MLVAEAIGAGPKTLQAIGRNRAANDDVKHAAWLERSLAAAKVRQTQMQETPPAA